MPEVLPADGAALEDHLVLREGARLVTEHVLHLQDRVGGEQVDYTLYLTLYSAHTPKTCPVSSVQCTL